MNILILAGDLTNYYLYKILKKANYTVALEGFNHLSNKHSKNEISLSCYKTIIAPIPLTIDGTTLYSPYTEENIHIDQLLQKADKNCKIIGGPFNFSDKRLYDITKNKEFTDLTVIPTCEEIIKILIDKSDITIYDSKISVLGLGRIGQHLTKQLELLGGKIINDIHKSEVIINTTKDFIINRELLDKINPDVLIIDITNNKISNFGKSVIKARGLPGKSAPKTVAEYIYSSLLNERLL